MWLTLRQNEPFNKVSLPLLHKAISKAFVTPWKGIRDSLGMCVFQDTGIQILCKWHLYSGFQSFEGFRITGAVFWIPPAQISRILESGFPQKGRQFGWYCELFHSNSDGMSILHAISNSSVYNTTLLNRNMVFLIPHGGGGDFMNLLVGMCRWDPGTLY